MANQVFIKKILDKLEPSLADFILSIWINSKIFKNKLIIYNLSKVKRLFFKNINAK